MIQSSDVTVIDDGILSEPYSKADILESVEHMPLRAKCFMSYLCAAALDLLDEVLHGRDLLAEIRRLDPENEESARQSAVAFRVRPKLRAIGRGMNRGRLGNDPFEKLHPILAEVDDVDPTLFSVTLDVSICIDALLLAGGDGDDLEALLAARLREVGTPPKKTRFLQRAYRDLEGLSAFINDRTAEMFDDFPERAASAAAVESRLGTIRKADRTACVAMLSGLLALVAAKTPLTDRGLASALAGSTLTESEREIVTDEVPAVVSLTQAWSERIEEWKAKKNFRELDRAAERLSERLDDDWDDPLVTALFLIYRCCSELYETEEAELAEVITPEAYGEFSASAVRAATFILESLFGSDDDEEDDWGDLEEDAMSLLGLDDRTVSLAEKTVPLLKEKLQWDTYHALGIVLSGAGGALASIRSDEEIRHAFVSEAGLTTDMFDATLARAEFLMGAAARYVDGEDTIPLEVIEAMSGRKGGFDGATDGIVRLPHNFLEETAHAFMTMPEDIAEEVFMCMGAGGAVLQLAERLPKHLQERICSMSGWSAAFVETSSQIVMAIADRMYDIREAAEEAKAHGGALN